MCCMWQAFYLARTGRPGPVLVDVPKDVQQQLAVPDWDVPMAIAGYMCALALLKSRCDAFCSSMEERCRLAMRVFFSCPASVAGTALHSCLMP